MRKVTFLLVLYACLSMLAPSSEFFKCIETTGLLFYKPWDALWKKLAPAGTDDRPTLHFPAHLPDNGYGLPETDVRRWWDGAVPGTADVRGFSFIAARSLGPVRPDRGRFCCYAGPDPLVMPGDPVVAGGALLGFVDDFTDSSRLPVVLLSASDSRTVVGEVRGTVAGREVSLVVGGLYRAMKGGISARFPSVGFALAGGGLVFTAKRRLESKVPQGFYLGELRSPEVNGDSTGSDVFLVPPHSGAVPSHAAVVVPSGRAGWEDGWRTPELRFDRVHVKVRAVTGNPKVRPAIRVSAGKEEGLYAGCLLIVNGFAAGRIERVGFFASIAFPVVSVGTETCAAVFPAGMGAKVFMMTVLKQDGFLFRVQARQPLDCLKPGMRVFLGDDPCSGSECYPAFVVKDRGDGRVFTLELPWPDRKNGCFCLKASEAP